jgi:hypothetical protein
MTPTSLKPPNKMVRSLTKVIAAGSIGEFSNLKPATVQAVKSGRIAQCLIRP